MDEIEGGVLARIPPGALSLTLTRSTIRMQHSPTWRVDKANPVEDLMIALEGRGEYLVGGERFSLEPGEAFLAPRGQRFEGWTQTSSYLGLAQHFTLDIYGKHDLIAQMNLKRKVKLSRWDELKPLIWHYRQSAPPHSVTLQQHHMFMVVLLAFLEDAFDGWKKDTGYQLEGGAAIDFAVMKAASKISTSPLVDGLSEQVLHEAPYNRDYFLRAFRDRIGRTPRQYQEFCRMERAMHLLETGKSVSVTASDVGFSDPYYFSRAFKRVIGCSPRKHMQKVKRSRDGRLMALDEDAQRAALAQSDAGKR
ncbi:DNA-binding transcriptional regulator AraC [Aquimixticola soesokkakensis]|uniref:DNA-binding transcriptional regulator AraC n=1 Tax=Aquimixticola soesokkakensis TaxID=1519096 RepID=A0A1Y5RSY3_9RHOB|nr:AraC family transcriptional regulator [Aquimixticola soesokkakensis]SLN23479.1 DNA-binding transcriptional regulator AraC [Aquimixticola soesokkakensis]